MPFTLVDTEWRDIASASASDGADGCGLLIRLDGVPVGFAMGGRLPGENGHDLVRRLAGQEGERLMQALLLRQLRPAADARPPSLTVAVCTKDREVLLKRCLEAILLHKPAWADIVVVDNAPSTTGTRDLVASLPGVHYALEPRAGLDIARNRAAAETGTEWLSFVDDDAVIDAGYFSGFAAALADHPDAGALTGLVLPYSLQTQAQILFEANGGFGRGFMQRRFGSELAGNQYYPCGAGLFGAGCNMAFRMSVLKELGPFDEALDAGAPLPGGGDLDIFYRVVRGGHVLVYEPRMTVFHEHRADMAGLRRQYWTWGLGLMAFMAKHRDGDVPMRERFAGLVRWWFLRQARLLLRALIRGGRMPTVMLWAELLGAVQGLAGEYDRSKRRIAAQTGRQ